MGSIPRGSTANITRPHNRTISSIRKLGLSRNIGMRGSGN